MKNPRDILMGKAKQHRLLIENAPELLEVLTELLATTELNLDEMEIETRQAINHANYIVLKATGVTE